MNFEQWYEKNKYDSIDIPVFKEYAKKAFEAGIIYAEESTFVEKVKRWLSTDKSVELATKQSHEHEWNKWHFPGSTVYTQSRDCKICGYREELKVEHLMFMPPTQM